MTLQEYLKKHYTPKTAVAYEREIMAYLCGHPGAASAVHQDIVNYLGILRKRYHNPKTLNRILCSIKAYYDFLHATGKRKDNPARSIRLRDKPSRDIPLQDLFTPEELEKLLGRKERYTLLTYRNRVLMSLLIYQGLLPAEMENLETGDLNLGKGTVYIRETTKTNPRELSLKPDQVMLFFEYLNEIRPKLLKKNVGAVGGNPDRSIGKSKKLLIGARGKPVTSEDITKHVKRSYRDLYPGRKVNAMSIRQSVITNLLKAGNDLRVVQVFAGHRYPGATEKYKQSDVEALKNQINKHHPIR